MPGIKGEILVFICVNLKSGAVSKSYKMRSFRMPIGDWGHARKYEIWLDKTGSIKSAVHVVSVSALLLREVDFVHARCNPDLNDDVT